MKSNNKKYLFGVSILGCLVLGVFLGNHFLSSSYPATSNYVEAPDAIVIARDITTYTQSADAIVIGTVRSVNDPYLKDERNLTVQQDAQIDVLEVLKGDPKMSQITVGDLGLFFTEGFYEGEGVSSLKGKYALLRPEEKVLLFLGTNSNGKYVVFGGPYGKYVIDSEDKVTSAGDFKTSLSDLKTKVQTALRLPVPKRTAPPSISVDN